MNIANVTSRFALVSGLDNSEIYKWRVLIDDACKQVNSQIVKKNLTEYDTERIEMLCALYAYRLYSMCSGDNISSFTAGDVKIALPDSPTAKADKMWNEYAQKSADLFDSGNFLFGVVM